MALAGRRALITGGSSGIGLACARRVLARGARVFLVARGEEELAHARDELGAAVTHVADVGDAAATAAAVSEAAARFGGLDAVVVVAGGGACTVRSPTLSLPISSAPCGRGANAARALLAHRRLSPTRPLRR